MTSPLERAARALQESRWPHCPYDEQSEQTKVNLQRHARAVLTAVREPSEGMLQAAEIATITARQDSFTDEWTAMIDAALSEGG